MRKLRRIQAVMVSACLISATAFGYPLTDGAVEINNGGSYSLDAANLLSGSGPISKRYIKVKENYELLTGVSGRRTLSTSPDRHQTSINVTNRAPGLYQYTSAEVCFEYLGQGLFYCQTKDISLTVKVDCSPDPIPNFQAPATSTTGRITVSWPLVQEVSSLTLERGLSNNSLIDVATLPQNATSFSVDVPDNQEYFFRLRGNSICGNTQSAITNVKVAHTPEPVSVFEVPEAGSTLGIDASWLSSNGANYYKLEGNNLSEPEGWHPLDGFNDNTHRATNANLQLAPGEWRLRVKGCVETSDFENCSRSTEALHSVHIANDGQQLLEPGYIRIRQATSGKCFSTQGGTLAPEYDGLVVLSSDCTSEASKFKHLDTGLLQHVASGMCIHPKYGTAQKGRSLVFWGSCGHDERLKFTERDSGSLEHSLSGLCVHPSGGSATPREGTSLVFWDTCDDERLNFEFIPEKKYLAISLMNSAQSKVTPDDPYAYAENCSNNDCIQHTWGVEINDGGSYIYRLTDTNSGAAYVSLKVASNDGPRSMGLFVNNVKVTTITADAKQAPREFGRTLAPILVNLRDEVNTIELRDSENSEPLDLLMMDLRRFDIQHSVQSSADSEFQQNPKVGQPYTYNINYADAALAFEWRVAEAGVYGLPSTAQYETQSMTQFSTTSSLSYCVTNEPISQRFFGYFHPEVSGFYQFALASDDQSQFYLVEEGVGIKEVVDVSAKTLIASIANWTGAMDFDAQLSGQSDSFFLEEGKKYYMEFRHRNGGGPGHFSVGVKVPGDSDFGLMTARNFSPFSCSSAKPCLQNIGSTGEISYQRYDDSDFSSLNDFPEVYESYKAPTAFALHTVGNSSTFTANEPGWHNLYFYAEGPSSTVTGYPDSTDWLEKRVHVDEPLRNGNAEQVLNWDFYGASTASAEQQGACGVTGGCFVISSTKHNSSGRIHKVLQLEPGRAYAFSADVMASITYPEDESGNLMLGPNSGQEVIRPYISAFWKQSRMAIPNAAGWHTLTTDFVVPPNGKVDLSIGIGNAAGQLFVDNLVIRKIPNTEVTWIETEHFTLNVHNEDMAVAGGYDVALAHAHKVSRVVEKQAELSGHKRLQCHNESQWLSKRHHIGDYGFSGNPIAQSLSTRNFDVLTNIWPTENNIDGIYTHEYGHNFDYNPWKFGNHLSRLVEMYPLDTLNYERSSKTEGEFRAEAINNEKPLYDLGCYDLEYFQEKLLEFKDDFGWGPIREVMHNTWAPGATPWASEGGEYLNTQANYMRWWQELLVITGVDGWQEYHSDREREAFNQIFEYRKYSNGVGLVNAFGQDASVTALSLVGVKALSAKVGWGDLGRGITGKDGGDNLLCGQSGPVEALFAHASSILRFKLNREWKSFRGQVGIHNGSVVGSVHAIVRNGDTGDILYTSGTGSPYITASNFGSFNVDVSQVDVLELEFTNGNGSGNSDWSMWIEPTLTR